MSKIISVLNQKGGAGKTTISTNLARALHVDGHKVLLVDSDPQGSARDWSKASEGSVLTVIGMDRPTLDKDIQSIKSGFDFVVIDGAPQIAEMSTAAIKCSDLVLVPVTPSPYDIWACNDLVEIIKARQSVTDGLPKAAFVISRTNPTTRLSKEIVEALEVFELPIFKSFTSQRVVYAESATTGLTVLDVNGNLEAKKEIISIKDEVLENLK
jgi:chromosome partitioning protein